MQDHYYRTKALDLDPATVECICIVAHEASRVWRRTRGDYSVPPWRDASPGWKDRVRERVLTCLEHPDAEPSRELDVETLAADTLFHSVVRSLDPRRYE